MAKLKKSDVVHVAKLANLPLTESEIEKFGDQLSEIVDYVSQLSEVDTSKVDPTIGTTQLENIYREDEPIPEQGLSTQEALSGTDEIYNNYFKVPAVIDKEQ